MDFKEKYNRKAWLSFLEDSFLPDDFTVDEKDVSFTEKLEYTQAVTKLGESASLGLTAFEIKHKSTNDARVGLSKDAFRVVYHYTSHARALVLFVPQNNDDFYRFSLVEFTPVVNDKGEVKRDYSNPRRYSFILGRDAKVKTPQQYLIEKGRVKDDSDLKSRFSVEVLNKEFYNKLASWYDIALNDIKIDLSMASKILDKKIDDELKPQAVIRIIIRLMFIWFMKEKGLIESGFFTREFNAKFLKHENVYYNAVLQNLFFAVLNKKINERRFRKQDNANHYDPQKNDYGISDVFRFKDFFKDGKADEFIEKTRNIPFVNGGLFTCHDYKFSGLDIISNKKNIEQNYIIDGFSDNPKERVKLSDSVIFQLIDLFTDYAFTIEENTPHDIVVALDPELLGTVFENLIGAYNPETKQIANDRKNTGSFYTPREIVDYMCKESLKESLKNRFPNLTDSINKLIDEHEDKLDFPQKNKIISAITDLKILDPACGSGAFPMGMFNLMVRTIEKLQEHKTTYKNKLDIITSCIYGIDIQNIAIEITKLRFFISLLVDYEIPVKLEDFEVLPNLETKFVTANTLIGLNLKGADLFNEELFAKCKELTSVFTPFTQAKTPKEKENIKNSFEAKKLELITLLKNNNMASDEIEKVNAWNPFSVCYASPFFDSEIMFGIKDGFDVVIGNPPYKQIPKGSVSKDTFPFSEGKDKGKQNLYKVFIEAAYNFSKDNGCQCLITQSSLLCDLSSQYTRELLLTQCKIIYIIEFPKIAPSHLGQVFQSVLQGTCISVVTKSIPESGYIFSISINNDTTTLKSLSFEKMVQESIRCIYPDSFNIPLVKNGEFDIIRKINNISIRFRDIIQSISQGDINLTTSKAYIINSKTRIKLLRGRNISKYYINYDTDEFIKPNYKTELVTANQNDTFLVCQEVTGTVDKWRLHFALTNTGEPFLFGHTANKVRLKNPENNLFFLSLLNSKLLDWYFRKTSTNNHVGGYEIEQLPIRIPTEQRQFIELVSKILVAKAANPTADTTQIETQIDKIVYKLYGLTEEEVKVVEGKV
ncbi:Eco57I restriction-modification methylase domain-containing protein [Leadbettera azotonutricia]|uniref:site-specific DNA-methyltransferase (adenine-specific) n=1 Tax=Leadbettera azotonutricia (strain ATCC BAA-888 / DSM 13862 / ZAS-9) TaxID=545695 RepID=F5YCY7_LEAAZ|nr:N-6 DNA methylase [Leadbettera azotonutricia]AEF81228.1 putative type IIS restriction enzyme R and M protein (ECO57IR) [Leadbettera azotonutricia ZAS-9]